LLTVVEGLNPSQKTGAVKWLTAQTNKDLIEFDSSNNSVCFLFVAASTAATAIRLHPFMQVVSVGQHSPQELFNSYDPGARHKHMKQYLWMLSGRPSGCHGQLNLNEPMSKTFF